MHALLWPSCSAGSHHHHNNICRAYRARCPCHDGDQPATCLLMIQRNLDLLVARHSPKSN
jgi:hypothetical protein